jgi:hypothetical protein
MNTALEYSTRVVQEGGRRCKKSTLNDLVHLTPLRIPLHEIIDPVFAKTSQNARFLLSEYERFGLVFTKTRVYKFGHFKGSG